MSKLAVRLEENVSEYDDMRCELVVLHDGEEIVREIDRGEPEDNTFWRDWAWVGPALESVYLLGLEDGKKESGNGE